MDLQKHDRFLKYLTDFTIAQQSLSNRSAIPVIGERAAMKLGLAMIFSIRIISVYFDINLPVLRASGDAGKQEASRGKSRESIGNR